MKKPYRCNFVLLTSSTLILMRKIIISLLLFSVFRLQAQFPFPLPEYTDSLMNLGEKIINGRSDFVRFEANEKFSELLMFMISHEKSVEIDFSSVRNLSVLGHENRDFRIFSWVVPRTDGSYECFGLTMAYNERNKKYVITELSDVKTEVTNAEKKQFRKGEWWGALYYEIIPIRSGGIHYFTLLGWDGKNAMSTRKIIDVLSFTPAGQPVFGASVFHGYGKQLKRVIFEYSENVQMVLRYEKQSYFVEKKKKSGSRKPGSKANNYQSGKGFRAIQGDSPDVRKKRKSATMIVFDRLIPINPSLTGVYEYYVPELNIVDGFLYFDGKWNYVPDIDARNAPSPKDEMKPVELKPKIPVQKEEQ